MLTRTPSPDILIRNISKYFNYKLFVSLFAVTILCYLVLQFSVVEMAVPAVREMLSTEALQTN